MIDKKPFRVTNEQANVDAVHYGKGTMEETLARLFRDYAADLLDARELIDKQEALIKEMLEFISDAVYTHPSQEEKALVILKKTKDYA